MMRESNMVISQEDGETKIAMYRCYVRNFPYTTQQNESARATREGISEYANKYPKECRQHLVVWAEVCDAAGKTGKAALGYLFDAFEERIFTIRGEMIAKARAIENDKLNPASKDYVKALEEILSEYTAGTMTRAMFLADIKELALENDAWDDTGDGRAVVERFIAAGTASPGGMDGTPARKVNVVQAIAKMHEEQRSLRAVGAI